MKLVHITLLSVVALTGCLDSGGGSSDDRSTGYITPTGIEGLSYQTNSQTGTTGEKGEFRYYPGEQLSLRVGNLALYDGIPAQDYVTPLEFAASIRDQLTLASVDDQGLLSHKPTEQQLIETDPVMNLTRLLLSLSWQPANEGRGIDIRERVISQLNAALPGIEGEIDFSVGSNTFAATEPALSPANQLLAEICFHPEGDELCEEPPSQAEIDNAPEAPQNQQERDPDVEYRQDLENKRERILGAVRTIEDISRDDVRAYLTRELDIISNNRSNRYYLDAATANLAAADTGIKTIRIRKVGDEPSLAKLEAISTNELDVVVHSFDPQVAEVEYFIAGDAGREGEVLVNFRPTGDYRWVRKQIRVIIE